MTEANTYGINEILLIIYQKESQYKDCLNIFYKQERRNNKLYNLKPNLIIVYLVAIMKRFSGLFSKMSSTSIHQRITLTST